MSVTKESLIPIRNIISDPAEISRFSNFLKCGEQYILIIFARGKYGAKTQRCLHRRLYQHHNADPDNLLKVLKCMQYEVGIRHPDLLMTPDSSLVVYINLNPRDIIKGMKDINRYLTDAVFDNFGNMRQVQSLGRSLGKQWLSCLAKCPKKEYIIVDIDYPEIVDEFFIKLKESEVEPVMIIKTRGIVSENGRDPGYHVVINKCSLRKNNLGRWLYTDFGKRPVTKIASDGKEVTVNKADIISDPMSPIPGTIQGGVVVKFT